MNKTLEVMKMARNVSMVESLKEKMIEQLVSGVETRMIKQRIRTEQYSGSSEDLRKAVKKVGGLTFEAGYVCEITLKTEYFTSVAMLIDILKAKKRILAREIQDKVLELEKAFAQDDEHEADILQCLIENMTDDEKRLTIALSEIRKTL